MLDELCTKSKDGNKSKSYTLVTKERGGSGLISIILFFSSIRLFTINNSNDKVAKVTTHLVAIISTFACWTAYDRHHHDRQTMQQTN